MKQKLFSCVILFNVILLGRPAVGDLMPGVLYATAQDLNQVIQINSDGSTSTALNVMNLPEGLAFRNSNELYVTGRPNGVDGVGAERLPGGRKRRLHGDIDPGNKYLAQRLMGKRSGDRLSRERIHSHLEFPGGNNDHRERGRVGLDGLSVRSLVGKGCGFFSRRPALHDSGPGLRPKSDLDARDDQHRHRRVNYVMQNLPLLNGLAIDSQGNIYLSEYLQNEIVKIAAGTDTITPFASLAVANTNNSLTIGPDGRLYAVGTTQTGADQIWSYNLTTGGASLYASNLPNITDIAFAPGVASVPEPTTIIMALIAVVSITGLAVQREKEPFAKTSQTRSSPDTDS